VVLVLNDRDLSQVTWEQRLMNGFPRYDASQALPDVRYADHALLLGLDGLRVERPQDVGPAWDRALAARSPFVLEVVTDANVPPLPPDLDGERLQSLGEVLRRDDDAGSLAPPGRLEQFVPR